MAGAIVAPEDRTGSAAPRFGRSIAVSRQVRAELAHRARLRRSSSRSCCSSSRAISALHLLVARFRLGERPAAGHQLDLGAADELAVAQLPRVERARLLPPAPSARSMISRIGARLVAPGPPARSVPMAASSFGRSLGLRLEPGARRSRYGSSASPRCRPASALLCRGSGTRSRRPGNGATVPPRRRRSRAARPRGRRRSRANSGYSSAARAPAGCLGADELLEVAQHPVLALTQKAHHEHQILRCPAHDLLGDV